MNRIDSMTRLALAVLLLSLASCSGQGPSLQNSVPDESFPRHFSRQTAPAVNQGLDVLRPELQAVVPAAAGPEINFSADNLPDELQGLGVLPYGIHEQAAASQKITSAIQELDPTVLFDNTIDVAVLVDSIILNPAPNTLSWAMYQLNLPDDGYPASITIGVENYISAGNPGQGFYILVSNYTSGRWVMSDLMTSSGNKVIPLPTMAEGSPINYLSQMDNFYVAILAWDDVDVQIGSFSQDTNTLPQALVVETSNTYQRSVTEEFQFRSESEDSDNGIASFSWDMDADDIEDYTSPVINHIYDTPGMHEVRLTVTDQNGATDTDNLFVYTFDTEDSMLPEEFMEALTLATPDPPSPVPLPEMNFDQTFERLLSQTGDEWYEIVEEVDNAQWKIFEIQDGGGNNYTHMLNWMPDYGEYYYEDHTELLPFADVARHTVQGWSDLQGIVQTGAAYHGAPVVNEGLVSEINENDPLAFAVKRIMNDYPGEFPEATFLQLQAEAADVPIDLQRAMARLLNAIRQAKPYHEEFLDPANTQIFGFDQVEPPAEGWQEFTFTHAHGMAVSHENGGPIIGYVPNGLIPQNFDYSDLFQGAAVLAAAIDEFKLFLDDWVYVGPVFSFEARTSLGQVSITGHDPDTIELPDWDGTNDGWYLLQVDTGGNDDYFCHAGANADFNNPISICIDVEGNDEYHELDDPDDVDRTVNPSDDNTHQQGSGRMGYGFLIDLQGNDTYSSVRMSQGCSNFGVGILADYGGGIDMYAGEAMCQGASLVGIGALLDDGGNDSYLSWQRSQAFGSFRGVGILCDQGGSMDSYSAVQTPDPAKPEYDPGSSGTNISFCQAASLGRSWSGDATSDPFIGSGGLAILLDDGGVDSYSVGAAGQGFSQMEGTSMLIDISGDDSYTSNGFSASCAINRATAMLWDLDGSDDYIVSGESAICYADNYSLAWLLEYFGDDEYEADTLAVACSERNGFTYMLDYNGNDDYLQNQLSAREFLGTAYIGELDPAGRDVTPTVGFLLDMDGTDSYTLSEAMLDRDGNTLTVADDNVWLRSGHDQMEPHWHDYEFGIGADLVP